MFTLANIMFADLRAEVEAMQFGAVAFVLIVVGFIVICILGSLFGGKTFGDVISKGAVALVIIGILAAIVIRMNM